MGSEKTDLTLEDVRDFLRDYSENNILLDEVENPDDLIEKAIKFVKSRWTVMPPVGVGGKSPPYSILLMGVSAWLLKSVAMLQLRNQASVRDGMISPIGIDDKAQLYLQVAGNLQNEFETAAREFKISRNVAAGFGNQGSGFRFS